MPATASAAPPITAITMITRACVEEINKEGKSWLKMSGGVPNESRWIRIYRNLPKLKEVKFPYL